MENSKPYKISKQTVMAPTKGLERIRAVQAENPKCLHIGLSVEIFRMSK